jgi:hypothetical protein
MVVFSRLPPAAAGWPAGSGKRAGVLALARPHQGRPARVARINQSRRRSGAANLRFSAQIDELLKQRTGPWRRGYV